MGKDFSVENFKLLVSKYKYDNEIISFVSDCFKTFEDYHRAIFDMEIWTRLYDYDMLGKEEYQSTFKEFDNARTLCHNSVLASVNALNRLAVKVEIGLIYDGEVSKEHPYRREVADAILKFVETVILERR